MLDQWWCLLALNATDCEELQGVQPFRVQIVAPCRLGYKGPCQVRNPLKSEKRPHLLHLFATPPARACLIPPFSASIFDPLPTLGMRLRSLTDQLASSWAYRDRLLSFQSNIRFMLLNSAAVHTPIMPCLTNVLALYCALI
jgi:hypothetical protein